VSLGRACLLGHLGIWWHRCCAWMFGPCHQLSHTTTKMIVWLIYIACIGPCSLPHNPHHTSPSPLEPFVAPIHLHIAPAIMSTWDLAAYPYVSESATTPLSERVERNIHEHYRRLRGHNPPTTVCRMLNWGLQSFLLSMHPSHIALGGDICVLARPRLPALYIGCRTKSSICCTSTSLP
jgi:hypothetical protein